MFRRTRRCASISGALVALWGHSITSKGFDMSNLSYRAGNSSALSPLHSGGGYGGGVGPLLRQAMENYSPLLHEAMKETDERKFRGLGKSPVPRIALKLGLQAARLNPYVRLAHMGFDAVYGAADLGGGWYQSSPSQPAQEGGHDWIGAGFTEPCVAYNYSQSPLCPGNYTRLLITGGEMPCLSGETFQVTTGEPAATDLELSIPPGYAQWYNVFIGPKANINPPICNRFHYNRHLKYYLRGGLPPVLVKYISPQPAKDPLYSPLPRARPAPAAIIEEYPSDKRPDPRLQRKYERLPYRSPAGSWQFLPRPGPAGKGPPRDDDHILRPPGRNEREKKEKIGPRQALKLLGVLYDAGTEAGDIIDVLWDNMKCKPPFRPGRPYGMSDKANYIYNNLGCLDLGGAIAGLLKNHFEDRYIYGKIFGTLGKHSPYGSLGPSHGGWIAR